MTVTGFLSALNDAVADLIAAAVPALTDPTDDLMVEAPQTMDQTEQIRQTSDCSQKLDLSPETPPDLGMHTEDESNPMNSPEIGLLTDESNSPETGVLLLDLASTLLTTSIFSIFDTLK